MDFLFSCPCWNIPSPAGSRNPRCLKDTVMRQSLHTPPAPGRSRRFLGARVLRSCFSGFKGGDAVAEGCDLDIEPVGFFG